MPSVEQLLLIVMEYVSPFLTSVLQGGFLVLGVCALVGALANILRRKGGD